MHIPHIVTASSPNSIVKDVNLCCIFNSGLFCLVLVLMFFSPRASALSTLPLPSPLSLLSCGRERAKGARARPGSFHILVLL